MKKLLLICLMGVVLTGCSGDKDVDKQKAENHTDVVQEVESQDTVETDDGTVEGNQLNEVSTGIAPEAGETNGVDKAPAKPVEDTEADIEDAVNSTAPVQDGTAEDTEADIEDAVNSTAPVQDGTAEDNMLVEE